MVDLSYPDSLKDQGNYRQAISAYQKMLSNNLSLRDRADINQKIIAARDFYNIMISISVGEAIFPVVNLANNRGIVLIGKVSVNEENRLSDEMTISWQRVKEITFDFLDNYLLGKIKSVLVLDWQPEKYTFSIKPIPNSNINLYDFVEGESIELAMFVSLISFILNRSVGNKVAFSGKVNTDFGITSVTEILEKTNVVTFERPLVKKFFISASAKIKSSLQIGVSTLEEIIKNIFPTFDKALKLRQNELGEKRITVLTYQTSTRDKKKHLVIKFKQPNNLLNNDAPQIYKFLKNNVQSFIPNEGAIVDGLFITYAVPMLVSLREVTNHVPDFIACRYSARISEDGYAQAFVIRSANKGGLRKEGEQFEYKINFKFES